MSIRRRVWVFSSSSMRSTETPVKIAGFSRGSRFGQVFRCFSRSFSTTSGTSARGLRGPAIHAAHRSHW
jgi:hypothetical protein